MSDTQPLQVFVSYAHADSEWRKRLEVHLTPLRAVGGEPAIADWDDTRIAPGSDWRREIKKAVEEADVAVLLVSADFLASQFIRDHELPPLLQAARERGAIIIPVIVSPSLFAHTPELVAFQAVNLERPLVDLPKGEQELVLVRVAETILQATRRPRARLGTTANECPPSEDFLERSTWNELIRIGDWVCDHEKGRILGAGMGNYLLSRNEYGSTPFKIDAVVSLSNFDERLLEKDGGWLNAGLVFGWKSEQANPRYYHILLTGRKVLLERIGARGGAPASDYKHLDDSGDLAIEKTKPYHFCVSYKPGSLVVQADDNELLNISLPGAVVGRVGLRPWRTQMECTQFRVACTA
ncbi:MAG: toll/interleukin-1 receptor domain-containing protein [Thermoleophilia bacterium]|nr:toll/interleukin-1 receptor domain-containing protein [Thermoleophilia bacterium]